MIITLQLDSEKPADEIKLKKMLAAEDAFKALHEILRRIKSTDPNYFISREVFFEIIKSYGLDEINNFG